MKYAPIAFKALKTALATLLVYLCFNYFSRLIINVLDQRTLNVGFPRVVSRKHVYVCMVAVHHKGFSTSIFDHQTLHHLVCLIGSMLTLQRTLQAHKLYLKAFLSGLKAMTWSSTNSTQLLSWVKRCVLFFIWIQIS